MITDITWQQFVAQYYNQAVESARYNLDRIKSTVKYWDDRIGEEDVMLEAVMTSLESTFRKYDPGRGAAPGTLLSNIVRNELVNEIKRASRALGVKGDLTENQEKEYTFREMVDQIPDDAMENLKDRLRSAILQLSPIDQSILGFFLDDPRTFVEEYMKALNVTANYVSVHKNRALAKLPSLMGVTKTDYFDVRESHDHGLPSGTYEQGDRNFLHEPCVPGVRPCWHCLKALRRHPLRHGLDITFKSDPHAMHVGHPCAPVMPVRVRITALVLLYM